ncbi:penicillin-binding protein 2, partial [bacterium]|nr:penicillin-binding protein 2 [bacterium]
MSEIKNKDRLAAINVMALSILSIILIARIFYLQIIKGNEYKQVSKSICAKVITKIAPRGIIYDRNGIILARSRPAYDLYVLPNQIKDPKQLFSFFQKIGLRTATAKRKFYNKNYLPADPLLIKKNLTMGELSFLEENKSYYSGLMINTRILRDYPYGRSSCHILGYVGEINARELKKLKGFGYKLGDIVGVAGIEKYYDHYLKGINGGQPLEVDPQGNPVRSLISQEPIPGANLFLTIDLPLQLFAEKTFGKNQGALVAINPNTGEILAMLSKPGFNPNHFTDFINEEEWKEINNKNHPLHNRAITGYPPGSIFKIITGMAALDSPHFNPKKNIFCRGYLKLIRRRFNCWRTSGHGKMDFFQGFIESCNVVFFNVGQFVGPDKIVKTAARFGLGVITSIDLPFETRGLIPTRKWKKDNFKEDWYPGDTLNMSIGQGYILVSPVQMALVVSSLANKNNLLLKPFLVKTIVSFDDKELLMKKTEIVGRLTF